MKKRTLKKSDVLREGYIKGLKEAQRIINEALGNDGESIDYVFYVLDKNSEYTFVQHASMTERGANIKYGRLCKKLFSFRYGEECNIQEVGYMRENDWTGPSQNINLL